MKEVLLSLPQYAGDPVSMAICEAVLCVIEEERLAAHAEELGSYIRSQLWNMAQKHPCIGDVRFVTVHVYKANVLQIVVTWT